MEFFGSLVSLIGSLVLAVLMVVSWCKLFHKAGKPWGLLFIPVYGTYLTYSIAHSGIIFWGVSILGVVSGIIASFLSAEVALIIICLILIPAFLLQILYCYNLASAFGKGGSFAAGLFFLFPIFLMILAFGSATYQGFSGYSGQVVTSTWTCSCDTVNSSSRISCEHCGAQKR